jgi:hypothetical protein
LFTIIFKLGTFMPHLPVNLLVDKEIDLPEAANHSFWLDSCIWQYPNFENVDVFVDRLMKNELLACEPVVAAGQTPAQIAPVSQPA